jgi:hypothetical protein
MTTKSEPLEVWLRLDGRRVVVLVVCADESAYRGEVKSPSMRGAQKECTADLIRNLHRPVGPWHVEATDQAGAPVETWRQFNPPS